MRGDGTKSGFESGMFGHGVAQPSKGGVARASRDGLRLTLAVLIFFTVSRAHQHYSFIGQLNPAMILFLTAVGLAVLNRRSIRLENIRATWPPKVVIGLGVLACLSIPFGISMGSAGSFFVNSFSKVLLTFLLIVVAMRNPADLKIFVWSFVLACGFLVWLSLFEFELRQSGGVSRLADLYTYDANDMGLVLVTGIPLCVVLYHNSRKLGRVVSGLILVGIGASLARSGSRGGFLGLLAVGVGVILLLRRVSAVKRIGILAVVGGGLVFMAPSGYWGQMKSLAQPTDDYNWTSEYGRKAVAERGIGYMLAHPMFGIGVGNFPRAEGMVSEVAEERKQLGHGYRWTASHNSFVQAGAEMGIPGLLLFSSLVFGSALGLFRLRKRLPRSWRHGGGHERFLYDLAMYLPVSLVGFAVSGFFVSFAYMDLIYLLTGFVTGTYLFSQRVAASGTESHRDARRPVAAREAVPLR